MQANALRLYALTVSGNLYGIRPDQKRGGVDYELALIEEKGSIPTVGYGQGMVGIGKFLIPCGSEAISLLKSDPSGFWERSAFMRRTSAVVAVFLDEMQAHQQKLATRLDRPEVRYGNMDKYRAETLAALRACSNHPAIVINEEYWEIIFREKL